MLNITNAEEYINKIGQKVMELLKSWVSIEISQLEKELNSQLKEHFNYLTFGYDNFYHFLMENFRE